MWVQIYGFFGEISLSETNKNYTQTNISAIFLVFYGRFVADFPYLGQIGRDAALRRCAREKVASWLNWGDISSIFCKYG